MGKKIFVYGGGVAIILFVLLFAGAGAILLYSEQRTIGEYFDSNGVQIHYTKEGEGVPVILVHGFAFNSDLQWRQPGIHDALLKDGYQVITFDCRGNGLSEKPHEREAYGEEMPNDIFRLMDHLKIEKAHIVGYSMGGFITLKFIEMHPERILSAAPCGITWHPVEEKDLEFTRRLATALEEDGDFSPLFERLNMPIPSGIGMKVARWVAQRSNDTKALASIMWEFPKFEVKEDAMKKNTVPTLTIVGDEDPLSEYGEIMHNAMQNHELVIVPGGNHMTTTRDDKFLDALLPFLKKNNPAQVAISEENKLKEAA